jgi:2-hydroxychromene-2-carboxylate isomerase
MLMKRKSLQGDESADSLALDVLLWMVQEPDRLLPFLNATGLTPDALRGAADDPAVRDAVLDHVMADEPVLLACARALEIPPERIVAAWERRRPPDFEAP